MQILEATESDYASHIEIILREHPKNIAEAQQISMQAAQLAADNEIHTNLPAGQNTPGHYFYALYDGGQKLGYLWLGIKNDLIFLYDIHIFADYRSKGYGTKTLDWIRNKACEDKCSAIWLHVFGHNNRAVDFYTRCGFGATNISMRQDISLP